MKQETYYVVVNEAGKYLEITYEISNGYVENTYTDWKEEFSPDCLFIFKDTAIYRAGDFNGTVKEVTITINNVD